MSYLDGALKAEHFKRSLQEFFLLSLRAMAPSASEGHQLSPRGGIKLFPRLVRDCLMAAEEEGEQIELTIRIVHCTH